MEQATAENTPEQVQSSVETLVSDGFDSKPPFFHALVATIDNKTIGYAFYYFLYSTLEGGKKMYLGELYIMSDYRCSGYGGRLFEVLMNVAKAEGCICMQWHVHQSDTGAMRFYQRYGAIDLTEKDGVHNFRMEKSAMINWLQNHK